MEEPKRWWVHGGGLLFSSFILSFFSLPPPPLFIFASSEMRAKPSTGRSGKCLGAGGAGHRASPPPPAPGIGRVLPAFGGVLAGGGFATRGGKGWSPVVPGASASTALRPRGAGPRRHLRVQGRAEGEAPERRRGGFGTSTGRRAPRLLPTTPSPRRGPDGLSAQRGAEGVHLAERRRSQPGQRPGWVGTGRRRVQRPPRRGRVPGGACRRRGVLAMGRTPWGGVPGDALPAQRLTHRRAR